MTSSPRSACEARRIVLLLFPDFQILDLTGPLAVFSGATHALRERGQAGGYETILVAQQPGPVRAVGPIEVIATHGYASRLDEIDTLLVVGGDGVAAAARDEALIEFVGTTARRARRAASVCTGAFVLGAAGMLDDRRATTHWAYVDVLARHFPRARLDEDAIFTSDGSIYTSAGVTAGMDLALFLVECDFGRGLSLAVARHLVMPIQRAGGQSQLSAQLRAQAADHEPLRAIQSYVCEHVTADLSVAALARRAAMSSRHFARVFHEQVGVTPAAFVERARVDVARRLLEQTTHGHEEVARAAGFGCARSMRRAFTRQLALTPDDYRAKLQRASTSPLRACLDR